MLCDLQDLKHLPSGLLQVLQARDRTLSGPIDIQERGLSVIINNCENVYVSKAGEKLKKQIGHTSKADSSKHASKWLSPPTRVAVQGHRPRPTSAP